MSAKTDATKDATDAAPGVPHGDGMQWHHPQPHRPCRRTRAPHADHVHARR
jgi:hypothetical protein